MAAGLVALVLRSKHATVSTPSNASFTQAGERPVQSAGEAPARQALEVKPPARESLLPPERATAAEAGTGGVHLLPGAKERAAELNDSRHAPERDIEIVDSLIADYRRIFGQNPPGGLNVEIVASLIGGNAKRLAIVPPDFPALNAKGELVDRWGMPFLFHSVSRTTMEVLSAGPDRTLWTADDVGTFTPANAQDGVAHEGAAGD
jgi:hypothetical protein